MIGLVMKISAKLSAGIIFRKNTLYGLLLAANLD